MATAPATGTPLQPSISVRTVDASLWWEPFNAFFAELENADVSSCFTESLEKKLKELHGWFLETVSRFKKPNPRSREGLDASRIKIGEHELNVLQELKDVALELSSILCLDEVQSYILVGRSLEHYSSAVDEKQPGLLHLAMLDYYTERQCLLKCTRQILMQALYFGSQFNGGSAALDEAQSLVNDGLEGKLLSVFEDLLSSRHPEQMGIDLYVLWSEETLTEDKLILDIVFLIYYESFSTCDAKCWKRLCALYEGIVYGSYNFQKLAVTPEAARAIYHVKVQLLLILIEALDLESLLQMIHDSIPFSQGSIGFSVIDLQQMDAIMSTFNVFEANEVGPLILCWSVFLYLVSSLPEKEESNSLVELDHIGYARQAFEASSLGFFLEILNSDMLKDSDGPVAGYLSVLRTFLSAFIASYEISLKFGDDNLKLILEILSKIYRGEESLCIQFWDKGSFIDGPIRCLLCNLEGEFPFRTTELMCLLSALCEGMWPSECVFNFLDKSVGLSTAVKVSSDFMVDAASNIVEASLPLSVPGIEGLVIPSKSRGQILRMIDENYALVRWEYRVSGVLVLLLRLGQELYMQNLDELIAILDLLNRLVNFNSAVCYSLLAAWKLFPEEKSTIRVQEKYVRIDIVEIVCTLVRSLSPSMNSTVMMSTGISLLAKMLRCLPSHVVEVTMKNNIFDVTFGANPFDLDSNSVSRLTWESWLLSGRLAKMLLIDCEGSDCSMTLSVLDFTINLIETGIQNDTVFALVVFSLQYVLVNHDFWKYKVKRARWKVTLKVLEVLKRCVCSCSHCPKPWGSIRDIILYDSSIHAALLRIICTTTPVLEKLNMSRLFDILDVEGLQLAISSGLDVLVSMISSLSKDSPTVAVFQDAVLSPVTKPVPVMTAAISFISYFRNAMIQTRAARLLSVLFIANIPQGHSHSNADLGLNDMQIASFKTSTCRILSEQSPWKEDLVVAILKLLSAAAYYQPAFLNSVIMLNESSYAQARDPKSDNQPNKFEKELSNSKKECLLSAILLYIEKFEDLFHRKPNILLCMLNFLRALWQGAPQFLKALELLKVSENFWRRLTYPVVVIVRNNSTLSEKLTENMLQEITYRYQFLSRTLDILGYEIFLQKKLMHAKLVAKSSTIGTEKIEDSQLLIESSNGSLKEIISTWFTSSLLNDLIKACADFQYDQTSHLPAKVASGLFAVHAMLKLRIGELGSFSVSLIGTIKSLEQKLCKLPAFLVLLTQYAERGYSQGRELETLILSDLFYQIQGELEGRQIDNKQFKELMQFLLDSEFLDAYKYKQDDDIVPNIRSIYQYDTVRLRAHLGFQMWDLLRWKESTEIAETMFVLLQQENSRILHSNSKLSALRGLIALLYMIEAELTNDKSLIILKISEQLVLSCIDHVCQCLQSTVESLIPPYDANEDVLDILEAQAELLLLLLRNIRIASSRTSSIHVLRTSGYCLKVLCGCRPSVSTARSKKLLLVLIVTSAELSCKDLHLKASVQIECIDSIDEASNSSLGLLPVLCGCIEHPDFLTLSLASIDLILKGFSTPSAWFPILQRHLPLQFLVRKLQDFSSPEAISVILKFILNIARVREGAEMLLKVGFLEYWRVLISNFSDGGTFCATDIDAVYSSIFDRTGSSQPVLGLSLSVLTAIMQSLGDSTSSPSFMDYVMTSILVENASLISRYLSAPDFPIGSHESKRASSSKSSISLGELKETQNILVLICVLARDWISWKRVLQNMESQLREKCIHLLAFISRAAQRPGGSPRRDAPLLCHPVLKEEFECYKKPPFIKSRNGWFALSALGCKLYSKSSSLSSRTTALILGDQSSGNPDSVPQTQLSDLISVEIYKIAFLLLKFLCIQAECAAQKAEDVGFVDLAQFPELPMPDILHGLQDQGTAIITELCEAGKTTNLAPETQEICHLLLEITVMALHLEFCVVQICGITPVLGRVETFSKAIKLLGRATQGHAFLKEPLNSLKQIVFVVYPELIQQELLL